MVDHLLKCTRSPPGTPTRTTFESGFSALNVTPRRLTISLYGRVAISYLRAAGRVSE